MLPLLLALQAHAGLAERADLEDMLSTIAARYAYLDPTLTDLGAVRAALLPQAEAATSRDDLIVVLERALDSLVDHHATLGTNLPGSTRLVPTGLDLYAEEGPDGRVIVTEVRLGWPAAVAGVQVGDEILSVNGAPVAERIAGRLPVGVDPRSPRARSWALLCVLAGTHDAPRELTLSNGSGVRTVPLGNPDDQPELPPVTWQTTPSGVGVIALHALYNLDTVPAFDAALDALRGSAGLVLDLRDTPGGGSTRVAEPIMGRFLHHKAPYQRVLPLHRRARDRAVKPRGPWTYDGPLVVLVDHWTGSMGEGMAIGLDGLGRATVVGTAMAGLRGAVQSYTLPRSQITWRLPIQRLQHINGTPREDWRPPVRPDTAGPGDPLLDAAIQVALAPQKPRPGKN